MVYKFHAEHDFFFSPFNSKYLLTASWNTYQKQLKHIIAWIFSYSGDTHGDGEVFLSSLEDVEQILSAAAVIWDWEARDKYWTRPNGEFHYPCGAAR